MNNSLSTPTPNFLNLNNQNSKAINIVVDIDGLPLLSSSSIYRTAVYGDPIYYGDAGLVYDGLTPIGTTSTERQMKVLLMMDGGAITISQRLEPEQGRGSISTLTMSFLDKDGYMTEAVSSGPIVDEILGRQVKVWFGYANSAWPKDYFVVWRGRVGQVTANPGKITMQFVDPNVVRRQQVFYCGQTTLSSDIDNAVSTVVVGANGNFFEKITGPNGSYDGAVRLFIKIDDEFIEYQQSGAESTGFGSNQFLNVARGVSPVSNMATPSVAASHTAGATVDGYIMLNDHAMSMALKLMLSGWNGPFLSSQVIHSFVITDDIGGAPALITNGIVLAQDVDAVRDLGITIGDYITITGASVGGNNVTCIVTGFNDLTDQPNRVILTDHTFSNEDPSAAVIAVRSQYDVYPILAGCQLPGWEVDVATFQFYKNTYLNNVDNTFQFLLSAPESGKTFIESELLLPLGAYSLTRQGKISMGLTKPTIADQRSQILDISNILQPENIQLQRGLNNRKFFNEIDWEFDCDENNDPTSRRSAVNADSINAVGISSVMPIKSRGARTSLGFLNIVVGRETYLFNRYARGSVLLDLKTTLKVGNQIEVGDIVMLTDNGDLQLPNFTDGTRDFGVQLLEVINRDLDLKTGICSIQLEGGVGALPTDRYGTIAPSSLLIAGCTSSRILITESFGSLFPSNEQKKWESYIGLKVRVHSTDYLRDETTVFTGLDPANNHAMLLFPALSFTPDAGMVVDLAQYPTNTDATDQTLTKLIHTYVDPTVAVVSGSSQTVFTVGGGDIAKFAVGQMVLLHNATYSLLSPEAEILSIVSNTITVDTALGFVPDAAFKVELIGFADGGRPYRMV